MKKIVMQQLFDTPIERVFDSLSRHATFNTVLWPVHSLRIKDAAAPQPPDGVGSTRKMGIGPIKPIRETITCVEPGTRIEYRMEKNPLFSHHFGQLVFDTASGKTRVTYTIELESRLPLIARIGLAQLKWSATRGLKKLASQLTGNHRNSTP